MLFGNEKKEEAKASEKQRKDDANTTDDLMDLLGVGPSGDGANAKEPRSRNASGAGADEAIIIEDDAAIVIEDKDS